MKDLINHDGYIDDRNYGSYPEGSINDLMSIVFIVAGSGLMVTGLSIAHITRERRGLLGKVNMASKFITATGTVIAGVGAFAITSSISES